MTFRFPFERLDDAYRAFIVERRLPHSWQIAYHRKLYQKPFDSAIKNVLKTRPMQSARDANIELKLLTCKRDLGMTILAAKSLLRFTPAMRVTVLNDGTLDQQCKADLSHHLLDCRIYDTEETTELGNQYPLVNSFREKFPHWFRTSKASLERGKAFAKKVFDFHLTSKSKKFLVLDSDTLFLTPPKEIIEWLKQADAASFHTRPLKPNLQIPKSDLSRVFPETAIIQHFNAGLMGVNAEEITLQKMLAIAERLDKDQNIDLISDECIWRYVFSTTRSFCLPYDRYPLIGNLKECRMLKRQSEKPAYVHYLFKHRFGIYEKHANTVISELM